MDTIFLNRVGVCGVSDLAVIGAEVEEVEEVDVDMLVAKDVGEMEPLPFCRIVNLALF